MLLTILITNVLVSFIVLLFFYGTALNIVDKNLEIRVEEMQSSLLQKLDTIISEIDQINYSLIMEEYENLEKVSQQPYSEKDTYESLVLREDLLEILKPLYQFQTYLSSVAVYSDNNRLASYGTIDKVLESEILKKKNTDHYFGSIQKYMTPIVVREIIKQDKIIARTVGFIDLDLLLSDQLEGLPTGTRIIVKNQNNEVIKETSQQDSNKKTGKYLSKQFNHEASQLAFQFDFPKAPLMGTLIQNLQLMLLLCVVIVLIGILVSTFMLMRITNNINCLSKAMDQVRNKNLETAVSIISNDELSEMGETFNSMVENIKLLMIENQEKERERSTIEMDFLQAQINPHFLSNTLNSITWMAELQEASNIVNLSKNLTSLLHATMYKGEAFVTVEEELRHVRSYIEIQQVAYAGSFQVTFDFPEYLYQEKILRFILQPLIENSILHNFTGKQQKLHGLIKVSGKIEDNLVLLFVEDNGFGIKNTNLEEIKNHKNMKKKNYSKIGVQNIDKRIKLYFGNEYGLFFESKENEFTRVTIKLPYLRGGMYEESSYIR